MRNGANLASDADGPDDRFESFATGASLAEFRDQSDQHSTSLPPHLGVADGLAVELLVVVHGDGYPQQPSGEFERGVIMRHRAAAIPPDVEAGPRNQGVESRLGP
jgi:hypothetical protein